MALLQMAPDIQMMKLLTVNIMTGFQIICISAPHHPPSPNPRKLPVSPLHNHRPPLSTFLRCLNVHVEKGKFPITNEQNAAWDSGQRALKNLITGKSVVPGSSHFLSGMSPCAHLLNRGSSEIMSFDLG